MSRLTANLCLALTALIWGSAFVMQKTGAEHIGALSFTAARFLLGGLVVLPLALRRVPPLSGRVWLGLLATSIALCGGAVLQQIGVGATSVANAGFLTGLYVPMVPLLGWLFLKETPSLVIIPAAALSLLGSWLLSGASQVEINPGDLWVIGSTIFWAAHVLLVGQMARQTGAPVFVAAVQFLLSAVIAGLLAVPLEQTSWAVLQASSGQIAYVGLLSVAIAFTLQSIALHHTPAADAAILLSGETVFAALAGWLALGETLGGLQLAGCAAILAAMLLVQLVPLLQRRRA